MKLNEMESEQLEGIGITDETLKLIWHGVVLFYFFLQ